jgi:hypothetical protein
MENAVARPSSPPRAPRSRRCCDVAGAGARVRATPPPPHRRRTWSAPRKRTRRARTPLWPRARCGR